MKNKKTLIIVDPQVDFVTGSLAVPKAKEIFPYINSIVDNYDFVIMTADWHPEDHKTFVENQSGSKVLDQKNIGGFSQTIWPSHCVQNTRGATPYPELKAKINKIIFKGTNPEFHPFGAFENTLREYEESTGLDEYLKDNNITEFDVVGLATDYCVKDTAIQGQIYAYKVNVLLQGCRGIDSNTIKAAIEKMTSFGVNIIS